MKTLYGYCDYAFDGRPYYVGIGDHYRAKDFKRNPKHANVAAKHGLHRIIEIEITGPCNVIWPMLCAWEIGTIVAYQTFHGDNVAGIGCNLTRGGEGFRGVRRKRTQAECDAISRRQIERYKDTAQRQKTANAIKRAKADPVKLQNHAAGQKERYTNPLQRQKAHDVNTQKKKVQQLSRDNQIIAEFPSISKAVQITGVKNIKLVCCGKRPFAGGFRWKCV